MKFSRLVMLGVTALLAGSFVAAEAAEIEQVGYRYRSRTRIRVRGRIRGHVAVVPTTACCPSYYEVPGHDLSWQPSFDHFAAEEQIPAANLVSDVGPPPGTLGRTYQLKSRPVPAEKHPRVAMLDIRVPGADEVLLVDLNDFREEDYVDGFQDEKDKSLWRFETKPLYNGLPHIYRVESRKGGKTVDVRYVRLVWGRLLEADF